MKLSQVFLMNIATIYSHLNSFIHKGRDIGGRGGSSPSVLTGPRNYCYNYQCTLIKPSFYSYQYTSLHVKEYTVNLEHYSFVAS